MVVKKVVFDEAILNRKPRGRRQSKRFGNRRRAQVVIAVDLRQAMTSSRRQLVAGLLLLFPRIEYHCCYNESGCPFAVEIHRTELAHLFEHLVLELLAIAHDEDDFAGVTHWNWREGHLQRGEYQVDLLYKSEAVTNAAIVLALRIVSCLTHRRFHGLNLRLELTALIELAERQGQRRHRTVVLQDYLYYVAGIWDELRMSRGRIQR